MGSAHYEVKLSCLCFIYHQRHCISHKVCDMVRLLCSYPAIFLEQLVIGGPKKGNIRDHISHQVTNLT